MTMPPNSTEENNEVAHSFVLARVKEFRQYKGLAVVSGKRVMRSTIHLEASVMQSEEFNGTPVNVSIHSVGVEPTFVDRKSIASIDRVNIGASDAGTITGTIDEAGQLRLDVNVTADPVSLEQRFLDIADAWCRSSDEIFFMFRVSCPGDRVVLKVNEAPLVVQVTMLNFITRR